MLCLASCNEQQPEIIKADGYLSLDEISTDESVIVTTKAAVAAGGSYVIQIFDKAGQMVVNTTYSAVKAAGNKISLAEGSYTFVARSTEEEVPEAEFEQPVYGVSKEVNVVSGQTTPLGSIVCTLLQCKVTVSYNDDFLAMVTGDGSTTVTVKSGYPLVYDLKYNSGKPSYSQLAGYFAIEQGTTTTMEVVFKGSIEGKNQKMTKIFTDVQARQWHQIKFVKKVEAEGNADFTITIDDFVEDQELANDIKTAETIIGKDPDAPTGDGGIKLESTCAFDISQPIVVPPMGNPFVLTMKATVPNKVKKFTVEIQSTNPNFINAVAAINDGSNILDLVNPSAGAIAVFTTILPFPYGDQVYNKDSIDFDLSAAQEPILAFVGTHTFVMNVTDMKGCNKKINVSMVVE